MDSIPVPTKNYHLFYCRWPGTRIFMYWKNSFSICYMYVYLVLLLNAREQKIEKTNNNSNRINTNQKNNFVSIVHEPGIELNPNDDSLR